MAVVHADAESLEQIDRPQKVIVKFRFQKIALWIEFLGATASCRRALAVSSASKDLFDKSVVQMN
jgi:hypothetical protein